MFTIVFPSGLIVSGLSRADVAAVRANGYNGEGTMTVRRERGRSWA